MNLHPILTENKKSKNQLFINGQSLMGKYIFINVYILDYNE